jgi:hypothetical protein
VIKRAHRLAVKVSDKASFLLERQAEVTPQKLGLFSVTSGRFWVANLHPE